MQNMYFYLHLRPFRKAHKKMFIFCIILLSHNEIDFVVWLNIAKRLAPHDDTGLIKQHCLDTGLPGILGSNLITHENTLEIC